MKCKVRVRPNGKFGFLKTFKKRRPDSSKTKLYPILSEKEPVVEERLNVYRLKWEWRSDEGPYEGTEEQADKELRNFIKAKYARMLFGNKSECDKSLGRPDAYARGKHLNLAQAVEGMK